MRKYYPEIEYIEINIQTDQLHMVLSFPPRYSISQVMGITKQNTGKVMKEEFDFIKKKYYGRGGL